MTDLIAAIMAHEVANFRQHEEALMAQCYADEDGYMDYELEDYDWDNLDAHYRDVGAMFFRHDPRFEQEPDISTEIDWNELANDLEIEA